MTSPLDLEEKFFTDFDGRFKARLAAVIPIRAAVIDVSSAPTTAKYDCRIKVEYNKDLMRLVEEGMLVAVRNFKSNSEYPRKYTLMEISRVYPEHYGLRGLSDHAYYPLQFEVIEQSVADWASDDRSTLMVQISAIPTNYDFIINSDKQPEYVKGFSYPVIGEKVHVLNKETVDLMYNHKILKKLPHLKVQSSIGTMKMFESDREKVPIYVDFENLIRYHFGIFAFTGGGKSNLVSTLVRKVLRTLGDVKVVIFDISQEYSFLLQDVLSDPDVPSKIIVEAPVHDVEQFYKILVKPRGFEKDASANKSFEVMLRQGKVGYYAEAISTAVTYEDIFDQFDLLKKENAERATSLEAIDAIERAVLQYLREKKFGRGKPIDEEFIDFLSPKAVDAMEKYKIWKSGGLYTWATTRDSLKERLEAPEAEEEGEGYSTPAIAELIEGELRLICLSIADPNLIKTLAVDLSKTILASRKREFKVEPSVLFVFDEGQEFIPAYDKVRGSTERECTAQVETLLRQGRKYGIGGCIATQRIAYLNTNALQQLHTYFVGPLPRPYDRSLISNTFTIDQSILEKTLEFAPGEWLLSSYIATGVENVPIFIKAENSEQQLREFLSSYGGSTR